MPEDWHGIPLPLRTELWRTLNLKIVIVSPHRDDAAFSLALTVDQWLENGHRVHVLDCFTRSNFAPLLDDEFLHSNDRASYVTALRARENEAWRRSYHGRRLELRGLALRDLALKDAPIRLRCAVDDVCTVPLPEDEKAVKKISKAIGDESPDALVIPLALGGHVDHRVACVAALGAAADLPLALYEDLPYAMWPGTAAATAARVHELLPDASAFHAGEPAFNVGAAVERKRRQVLCYDSQVSESEAERMARESEKFGGRERLWGNAAWRATALRGQPAAVNS